MTPTTFALRTEFLFDGGGITAIVGPNGSGKSNIADAIPLDADRKATFASNLMTVMASDQPTAPVVNVGTLSR